MHITINENGETEIVEEERNDDRWLIAKDIGIVRPQILANGYVPEHSIEKSVNLENTHGRTGWSTPATLNHPRNVPEYDWYDEGVPDGQPVLSSNDGVTEELGLGQIENDYWDGEFIRGDLAVNADQADEIGGEAEDVVNALENGDPLNVSSQYLGVPLPPGEYDGAHRDEAEVVVAPDSVAVLPNKPGQCSVVHGCGVNPQPLAPLGVAANVAANATGVQLSVVGNLADDSDDPVSSPDGKGDRRDMQNAPTANELTPEQVALIEDVLEEFTDAQGNATVDDLREWLWQNDDLDPDAATALEAALGDVFDETPDDWNVEDEFSDWLESQSS